jgi:hypothetical protein
MTLFCYDLPIDIVLNIIDSFLFDGWKSLIRISLALLKVKQEEILKLEYEEGLTFLKKFTKSLVIEAEELMSLAYSFKVSKRLLNDLQGLYLATVETKNEPNKNLHLKPS